MKKITQIGLTGSRSHFGACKTTEWSPGASVADSSIRKVAIGCPTSRSKSLNDVHLTNDRPFVLFVFNMQKDERNNLVPETKRLRKKKKLKYDLNCKLTFFHLILFLLLKIGQGTDLNASYKSTQDNCVLFSQMLEYQI